MQKGDIVYDDQGTELIMKDPGENPAILLRLGEKGAQVRIPQAMLRSKAEFLQDERDRVNALMKRKAENTTPIHPMAAALYFGNILAVVGSSVPEDGTPLPMALAGVIAILTAMGIHLRQKHSRRTADQTGQA